MNGTVDGKVYFAETGNPKFGSVVHSMIIPQLDKDECFEMTHNALEDGNYKFKAYQEFGHPGLGELWSETCKVACD